VLSSLAAGVVVIDSQMLVKSWNRGAEELWGLRADEVRNQPFLNLDFGLPTAAVVEIVKQCFTTGRRTGPLEVAAVNRIGRSISCKVTCTPLDGNGEAVVVLMEEVIRG
jgi:two-component system, chemotaxis family, CheB/CheR fusion protein